MSTARLARKARAKADLGCCSESCQARQKIRIATSHQGLRRSAVILGGLAVLEYALASAVMLLCRISNRTDATHLSVCTVHFLLTRFDLPPQCFGQHVKLDWLDDSWGAGIDLRFEFAAISGCKHKWDLLQRQNIGDRIHSLIPEIHIEDGNLNVRRGDQGKCLRHGTDRANDLSPEVLEIVGHFPCQEVFIFYDQ
jgi:hypothetical protein